MTPAVAKMARCWGDGDPLFAPYHDEEWGFPVLDERGLFEKLSLEAFQSGMSWRTILTKRPAFRAAFADFDPDTVAAFDETDVKRLLADVGIVRNRRKIEATLANAAATVALRADGKPLDALVRRHVPTPSLRRPRAGTMCPRRGRSPWPWPASSKAAAFASSARPRSMP